MSDVTMFAPATGLAPNGMAQFGSDATMNVWFFRKEVHQPAESLARGLPIYKATDFVHIQQPGERDFIERPASESDRYRWQRQWQAYQEKRDPIPDGTPIEMLFPQNPEIPPTLHFLGIHTIQQCAAMGEVAMGRIGMGGRDWKQKAERYVAASKDTEVVTKMQAELAERDNRLEVLERANAQLSAAITALQAKANGIPAAVPADPVVETPPANRSVRGKAPFGGI